MTLSAVLKRASPSWRWRASATRLLRSPSRHVVELLAVGDVERAGALLDRAVQVRDPDLEHVERHGLGERVDLLVDDRAAIGGGRVDDPVDRERGEVHQPERVGRRRGVGAHRFGEAAQQRRHPAPEAAVGGHGDAPERRVEAGVGGVAAVDRQVAAALHQDLGDAPVERQRLQHPHPRPGGVAVGDGRGDDDGARDRHGELGEPGVAGEEGRRPHRAPGVVDVDRDLVGHRPGGGGERRVALAFRAAAVARGGVVGEDPLARADGGADGAGRPVVLRPHRADQGLGGLAGVHVLVVDPLR